LLFTAWRKLYEHDYKLHHDLKPVSKNAAWQIGVRKDKERREQP